MKKIIVCLIAFFILIFSIIISPLNVHAHDSILNIEYDECNPDIYGDGEDGIWYYLCELGYSAGPDFLYYHLDNDITTIKYYFEESDLDGTGYRWETDVSELLAEEIKQS